MIVCARRLLEKETPKNVVTIVTLKNVTAQITLLLYKSKVKARSLQVAITTFR